MEKLTLKYHKSLICNGNLNVIGVNSSDRNYKLRCDKCNHIVFRDELQTNCDFRIVILTEEETIQLNNILQKEFDEGEFD